MSRIFFVNVWRKDIFDIYVTDIYVTEYGTALTTILPILFLCLDTRGLGASGKKEKKERKKKRYYVVLQGGELTCFHFFGSSCSIDRGFGAPWYFQEVFPPVGGQVVFLSGEAPVVGVGLRAAEVSYTNQDETAWGSEVVQALGWPLPICVQTFPCVGESFWLARCFHPFKLWWGFLPYANLCVLLGLFLKEVPFASLAGAMDVRVERVLAGFLIGWTICFGQSRSPLELSQFSRLWRLLGMQMGFLSKTDLEGHINWRKVGNFVMVWMDESIWLVEVTRLRVGGSVHRWVVVSPTFVRLRVFAPFCFGSCMMPQRFGGLHWQLGVPLEGRVAWFSTGGSIFGKYWGVPKLRSV